ncbi:MAG: hypothetical protein ABID84_01175 [Chloroflexota bacterium]
MSWVEMLGIIGFGLAVVATVLTALQMWMSRPQVKCFFHRQELDAGVYLIGMVGNKPPRRRFQSLGFTRTEPHVVVMLKIFRPGSGTLLSEHIVPLRSPEEMNATDKLAYRASLPPSDMMHMFGVVAWPKGADGAYADIPNSGNPPLRLPEGTCRIEVEIVITGVPVKHEASAIIGKDPASTKWLAGKNVI